MRHRQVLAAILAVVLAMGVASASSLGTFNPVSLGATSKAIDVCQADAELIDLSLGVIPLATPGVYTVDLVRLSSLSGDCAGTSPVVVLIGQDPWLVGTDEVLAVQSFNDTTLSGNAPVDLEVQAGDALDLLSLDLTTVVTEVRVAFCPAGHTCT